jgi:mono/diheme cytochrome c family protein
VKKPAIHFILFAVIGLGLGYLIFDVLAVGSGTQNEVAVEDKQDSKTDEINKEATDTSSEATPDSANSDGNILQAKGCLGCHAVEGLNLEGGATGPDLTQAFNNVEGKHGKPLDEFLKEPTSAVMSGVIGGNPLTEEEINQIAEALKKASESN